jgi:hypothetical protein
MDSFLAVRIKRNVNVSHLKVCRGLTRKLEPCYPGEFLPSGNVNTAQIEQISNAFFFISLFNQLDAQNLFHSKFYFMPLHVSSTCAHHQEVKTSLHSLWYHHTYTCDDTRGCVMKFWPPDDEHMCSKHVEGWNKTYCEKKLCIKLVIYWD